MVTKTNPNLRLPHSFQELDMRGQGIPKLGIFDVGNPPLPAYLLYNTTDGRVMYVGYLRRKMVFNLEIQATQKPG
jgi:hypothetical protein